jgi:ElaB/YqjD/DUF883 family membrane-anchored ribosome-binding protein
MDSNSAEGTVKEVAGKALNAARDPIGDTGNQTAEKVRQLSGKTQQLYADTAELVRNKTVESPFTTLAIAAGLGFLLSAIWATANSPPPRSFKNRRRDGDQD